MDTVEPFEVAIPRPLPCPDYAIVPEDAFESRIGHLHAIIAMQSGRPIVVGHGIVKRADVRLVDGTYWLNMILEVGPDISAEALDAVRTLPSP